MATFAEYLRSQGATEDDIKVLDTPIARKAHEALEARIAESETKMKTYEERVNAYYDDTKKATAKLQADLLKESTEAARSRAALLKLQEIGLADVAKDLGWTPEAPKVPDTPKYVTQDDIMPALNSAGDGLATLVDIQEEHKRLFPNIPFSARAIRNEQIKTGKSFEQYWMEKYDVAKAREIYATKEKESYEARLRKEGADAERAKFASEYGNPALRPAVPSNSPFVPRKTEDNKTRQPWAASEETNSDARVRRATENLLKRQEGTTTH